MVIGSDDRKVVTSFNEFPLSTVVAVDVQLELLDNTIFPGFGSGIAIAPNYVLAAGHTAFFSSDVSTNAIRITTSLNQNGLLSREIDAEFEDPAANVIGINFPANYDETLAKKDDIALLRTNNELIDANNVIGLIAFANPEVSKSLSIATAGYPGDNVSSNIPGNSGRFARDLVRAPGEINELGEIVNIASEREFLFSDNVGLFLALYRAIHKV